MIQAVKIIGTGLFTIGLIMLSYTSYYKTCLETGLGLYGLLLNATSVTHSFFLTFLIVGWIFLMTDFYPKKNSVEDFSLFINTYKSHILAFSILILVMFFNIKSYLEHSVFFTYSSLITIFILSLCIFSISYHKDNTKFKGFDFNIKKYFFRIISFFAYIIYLIILCPVIILLLLGFFSLIFKIRSYLFSYYTFELNMSCTLAMLTIFIVSLVVFTYVIGLVKFFLIEKKIDKYCVSFLIIEIKPISIVLCAFISIFISNIEAIYTLIYNIENIGLLVFIFLFVALSIILYCFFIKKHTAQIYIPNLLQAANTWPLMVLVSSSSAMTTEEYSANLLLGVTEPTEPVNRFIDSFNRYVELLKHVNFSNFRIGENMSNLDEQNVSWLNAHYQDMVDYDKIKAHVSGYYTRFFGHVVFKSQSVRAEHNIAGTSVSFFVEQINRTPLCIVKTTSADVTTKWAELITDAAYKAKKICNSNLKVDSIFVICAKGPVMAFFIYQKGFANACGLNNIYPEHQDMVSIVLDNEGEVRPMPQLDFQKIQMNVMSTENIDEFKKAFVLAKFISNRKSIPLVERMVQGPNHKYAFKDDNDYLHESLNLAETSGGTLKAVFALEKTRIVHKLASMS